MPAPALPSPEYLRQRLRYEPETGRLFWRYWGPHGTRWNDRYAGTEAFTAVGGRGYRYGKIDNRMYRAHRVIWALVHGVWPVEVDHEDHDRLGNRISNLQATDRLGNTRNKSLDRRNTSGATGVCWDESTGKWRARIAVNGKRIQLGRFDTFGDAVRRREAAEFAYGFHPNHGK